MLCFEVRDARDGVPYDAGVCASKMGRRGRRPLRLCVTRVRCRGDGLHRPRATEDGRPYKKTA
ncbi:MAG: hypothetical protein FWE47_02355 [Oscillospiraceae bacterium]|nr:hypothetical protein [Oscillospiraceae bacterium]